MSRKILIAALALGALSQACDREPTFSERVEDHAERAADRMEEYSDEAADRVREAGEEVADEIDDATDER